MKSARMLRLLGDIDPSLVDTTPVEELPLKKQSCLWVKWVAVAACVVLIVSGVSYSWYKIEDERNVLYPMDSIRYEDDESMILACLHFNIEEPYSFYSMATKADVIVVADVVAAEKDTLAVFNERYAYVAVREVLKGDISKKETLCVVDGACSNYGSIYGVPRLQVGHRVLLFLGIGEDVEKVTAAGETVTIYRYINEHPYLGKFYYDADGEYHEASTYADTFPFPISKAVFCDYEPKTLEEIKTLIQEEK